MKKLFKIVLSVMVMGVVFNPLYAHGGHKHAKQELSEDSVQALATTEVKRLIQADKISPSWVNAPRLTVRKVIFAKKMEWVVSYKNKRIPEKEKRVLYIFLSLDGKITGANYSGK